MTKVFHGAALSGVALALSSAATAAGGPVPDGTYRCQAWLASRYVDFGTVRSADGALSPDPIAKTGGTVTGIAATADGITVSYTTARGYRESMDCKRI